MVEGRKSLSLGWEERDINREKGAGREDQGVASQPCSFAAAHFQSGKESMCSIWHIASSRCLFSFTVLAGSGLIVPFWR